MSLYWYLKYKRFTMMHSFLHIFRSPKTFQGLFMLYIFYGFFIGDRTSMYAGAFAFVVYYIYVDYCRGVPARWKRDTIIKEAKEREHREVRQRENKMP